MHKCAQPSKRSRRSLGHAALLVHHEESTTATAGDLRIMVTVTNVAVAIVAKAGVEATTAGDEEHTAVGEAVVTGAVEAEEEATKGDVAVVGTVVAAEAGSCKTNGMQHTRSSHHHHHHHHHHSHDYHFILLLYIISCPENSLRLDEDTKEENWRC
jgi:hypothetical protein